MAEKRYKRLVSSIDYYYCIDTTDDKGLTEEDMLNLLNEQDENLNLLIAEARHINKQKHNLINFLKENCHSLEDIRKIMTGDIEWVNTYKQIM